MIIDGYTEIDHGTVPPGVRWEIGRQGERLVVAVGGSLVSLNGVPRDRFAEAVARAVTPGQAEQDAGTDDCGCGLGAARCRAAEDGDFSDY